METSQSSTGTTPPNMPAPSTYSPADSPASLSAWLANARAQTTNATCSLKLSKRLRLYNRESVFLKTSPASSPARPLSKFTARSTGSATDPTPPLVLGSADCGNIHKRERVWIYAARQDSDHRRERIQRGGTGEIQGQPGISRSESIRRFEDILCRPDIPDPLFCGVDDEFPDWQQRLKAVGNGQDPIVMATAFNLLHDYPARHGHGPSIFLKKEVKNEIVSKRRSNTG